MNKWLHLTYENEYGVEVGHHMPAEKTEDIIDLIERYRINPNLITRFTVDGKDYDIRKVLATWR